MSHRPAWRTRPYPNDKGEIDPWPGASAALVNLLVRGARITFKPGYTLHAVDNRLYISHTWIASVGGEFPLTVSGLRQALKACRDHQRTFRR